MGILTSLSVAVEEEFSSGTERVFSMRLGLTEKNGLPVVCAHAHNISKYLDLLESLDGVPEGIPSGGSLVLLGDLMRTLC